MPWLEDWDEQLYEEGYEAGQSWVERARPDDLKAERRRLRRFSESEDWDELWLDPDTAPNKFDIMSRIDSGSEQDPQPTSEHWTKILNFREDTNVDEPEFLLGFVEGALGLDRSSQSTHDEDSEPITDDSTTTEDQDQSHLRDADYGKDYRSLDIDASEAGDD